MYKFMALATLLMWPVAVYGHGELSGQIDDLSADLLEHPGDPSLYLRRGHLLALHGEPERANADYLAALEMRADYFEVHLARGELLLSQGRPGDAIEAIDLYLEIDPGNGKAWHIRAQGLALLGRKTEAIDAYDRLINLCRRPIPEYYIGRATLAAALGADHIDEAVAGLEEGIARLGPVLTLNSLAIDFDMRIGKYDKALARLQLIETQYGRKEGLYARRGNILLAAGRLMEAGAEYSNAFAAIDELPPHRRDAPGIVRLVGEIRECMDRINETTARQGDQ